MLQDDQPAHGQQHGGACALQDAGEDQLIQIGGHGTGRRPCREQHDGPEEHPLRAEAVGQPAAGRDQRGHGEHVGHHHGLHAQRAFAQAGGHGGQRRVDDGAVQCLHEEPHGHQPQQDTG